MSRRVHDRPPVVIGGCARSGTTLLLSLLSCHPRVYAIPEETFLLCPGAYGNGDLSVDQPLPTACKPPNLDALNDLIDSSAIPFPCRRWAEKTPRNALCFASIKADLPTARLVYVVRDGRDVVTSTHPSRPGYWVTPQWWVDEVNAGVGFPGALTVRYEDLIGDTRPTLDLLLDHIGEDWDDSLAGYPHTATVADSRNWQQPARPLNAASVGRWRQPQHARRARELAATPGATSLLERLGYT